MGPLAVLPKLSRLSLLLLISTILPTTQASHLFVRQAQTCGGNQDLQQCGNGFPSEFCCGKDATCMPVNTTDVQSVICCPKGLDCSFIQPVPCDVSQYNATLHPDNQIHISNTDGIELPKCGSTCCPLGYTCNGGMCSASKDSSPTSTTSPTPSPTDPASASQTSDCAAAPVTQQTSPSFDGKSFAAGFFPGIVIGALGTLGLIWIIKKRRESEKNRYSGDFGHVARTISDPIYNPQLSATRTDFIRRGSQSATSSPSVQKNIGTQAAGGGGASGLTPKIKSMWDRTPKLTFNGWSGLPSNPAPPAPAVRAGHHNDPYTTPPATSRRASSRRATKAKRPLTGRSTSTETIDVLMPAPSFLEPPKAPGMREHRLTQDSGNTTFTKLMERAGYGDNDRDTVRNFDGTPARR
ncbi:hypothetical protein BU26DRAFT_559994 [Trematosphaeria pertusa]|uniref:Mid2 domain-containing protein n=1 Tax=Trematosphaeria pertusa TaxID=390896 RepID=A0A6A6IYK2_9PLEO|nr:uncharacterized protein BU26DRAFT_559994 [Trematosphaeria pertusa]KAF2255388.1 hypothetical protein BU26DRAFT_559994 [Trematosphaeria pertusa]